MLLSWKRKCFRS